MRYQAVVGAEKRPFDIGCAILLIVMIALLVFGIIRLNA